MGGYRGSATVARLCRIQTILFLSERSGVCSPWEKGRPFTHGEPVEFAALVFFGQFFRPDEIFKSERDGAPAFSSDSRLSEKETVRHSPCIDVRDGPESGWQEPKDGTVTGSAETVVW